MKFLSAEGVKALEEAVAEIEKASGAEIVLAVRPRARHWLVQHLLVGIVAGIGVLAFTLWSDHEFLLWQMLVLPVLAGLVGTFIVEAVPPLYRFLAPQPVRYEHVRDAARAMFVEKRVHATKGRTGMLVYIALHERLVELVGDLAICDAIDRKTQIAWAEQIETALPRGPEATAKALAALAPELAKVVPHRADDINEIPDAIQVVGRPPRR
jgi:putative membrane protein